MNVKSQHKSYYGWLRTHSHPSDRSLLGVSPIVFISLIYRTFIVLIADCSFFYQCGRLQQMLSCSVVFCVLCFLFQFFGDLDCIVSHNNDKTRQTNE